jgi:ERCC4-type nuclease
MINILFDNREQMPFSFEQYPDVTANNATLYTADYSLKHFTDKVAIELKNSISDLSCGVTSNRDRFKHTLFRMRSYDVKTIVLAFSMNQIIKHQYRSKVLPQSILGSISSWSYRFGIQFMFCDNRQNAEFMIYSLIKNFYQNQIQMLKQLKLEK